MCSDFVGASHSVLSFSIILFCIYTSAVRRSTRPSLMREVDLTALSEAFNIPLGLDSDSDESDQEYAPHHEGTHSNYSCIVAKSHCL